MSQGKAGEEGGAASSDVEAASPAETLTTSVFGTSSSRVSATPMTADSTLERGGANDVSSSLRRHLRAPTTLLEEEREEEAMPQGAGGAAWSDAVSRVVTRMALQRLLELATGAIRNLLRGLGEATPARRVAPLGQFADVLLSSIEAIQQLASAEFLAAEFREFPAAEFRAPVEDSAAATSPRGSPEERPTLPPHRLLPVPATTTPGSAEWEAAAGEDAAPSSLLQQEEEVEGMLLRGRHLQEGPERLARARNREHRVLEGQGPEASAAGGDDDDPSPPRREPRWTLARSRSPPRREPRS